MPWISGAWTGNASQKAKWNTLRSFSAPYDIVYKICHHLRLPLTLIDPVGVQLFNLNSPGGYLGWGVAGVGETITSSNKAEGDVSAGGKISL